MAQGYDSDRNCATCAPANRWRRHNKGCAPNSEIWGYDRYVHIPVFFFFFFFYFSSFGKKLTLPFFGRQIHAESWKKRENMQKQTAPQNTLRPHLEDREREREDERWLLGYAMHLHKWLAVMTQRGGGGGISHLRLFLLGASYVTA